MKRLVRAWGMLLVSAACGVTACGEEETKAGELGGACGSDGACADGLECTGSGDGTCTLVAGGSCDPDSELDNGGCSPHTVCEGGAADAGTDEATCRLLEGEECEPGEGLCADGLQCAAVASGGSKCFAPVVLEGMVSDTSDGDAIEGAHVIGIDEEGSAVTSVSVTDADGNYSLAVPVERNDDGSPVDTAFTLRAAAQDYQAFPKGVRVALPISVEESERDGDRYVVDNALTDVGLIPLPSGERFSISGRVVSADSSNEESSNITGVLIVAAGDTGAFSATTDADGEFTIFNVVDGSYEVSAYAARLQVDSESATVDGEAVTELELMEATEGTVTVSGNIQIVNAPGGAETSVILVVADTFEADAARGEVPRGLRAPRTGVPNVDGDFVIEGVPDGEYVVLAAYENDDLVRDPDTNISGTSFVSLSVSSADGESMSISDSFKVTEALEVMSPGADAPEAVSSAPTLTWADDSSEDWYEVRVFDAFGDEVWSDLDVPSMSGSGDVSVDYGGPLEPGMYYQFRVLSWRQPGNGDPAPISATEDLRGVFFNPAE